MKPELLLSKKFGNLLKRRKDNFSFRIESSQTCPGAPDWVIHLKTGHICYVELKAGHVVTAAQRVVHHKLRECQVPVFILTQLHNSVKLKDEDSETEFETLDLAIDELIRTTQYGKTYP